MKKLTERDRARILDYVNQEPEVNIFFIGDIENYGVDCEDVSVFAHEKDGEWDNLVLRFMGDYVVYSQSSAYDASAVADFLKSQEVKMINGKAEIISRLRDYFPDREYRTMTMTKCTRAPDNCEIPGSIAIRRLTADDAEITTDLMMRIEEFKKSYPDRISTVKKLRTSLARGTVAFGAFKGGSLVSAAQATAGNTQSAMVVGVATHPDARGRGYASAVVTAVCHASFDEGKNFLCLFYDNPQAGRIYNRIGFLPIGEYALFG